MKKALMGTTALVAAAVTTGAVTTGAVTTSVAADEMMAEPISISVGGRSHWGLSVRDNEAAAMADDFAISNDVQLSFKGSTVLDSGLEVAVSMVVEGEEGSDSADAGFAEISGSFGTIRVGNDKTAAQKMATTAPYATYFFGINDSYWGQSASSIQSDPWFETYANSGVGDSASVLYFSPVINGFQFGLSYAPEAGTEARSATASVSEGHDIYSFGLRYDGAFGDAGVTFAAGYSSKDVPMMDAVTAADGLFIQATDNDQVGAVVAYQAVEDPPSESNTPSYVADDDADGEPDGGIDTIILEAVEAADAEPGRSVTEWAGGIVVSMSGVSVGATMSVMDDDAGSNDLTTYDLGIKYGEGPWSVSANLGTQEDKDNMIDNDFARLLANYNIGPGINLAGAIGVDSPNAGDNKGKDTSFAGVALAIEF